MFEEDDNDKNTVNFIRCLTKIYVKNEIEIITYSCTTILIHQITIAIKSYDTKKGIPSETF